MKKRSNKTRLIATLLVGMALSVATVTTPHVARADAGVAFAVGGVALLGALFFANDPVHRPYTSVTQTFVHPVEKTPMNAGSYHSAIVYSLASPLRLHGPAPHHTLPHEASSEKE